MYKLYIAPKPKPKSRTDPPHIHTYVYMITCMDPRNTVTPRRSAAHNLYHTYKYMVIRQSVIYGRISHGRVPIDNIGDADAVGAGAGTGTGRGGGIEIEAEWSSLWAAES